MKKKNRGFILFGVAGVQTIVLIISMIVFPRIYDRLGIPSNHTKFISIRVLITSLITIVILVIVGIILLIKYRNE